MYINIQAAERLLHSRDESVKSVRGSLLFSPFFYVFFFLIIRTDLRWWCGQAARGRRSFPDETSLRPMDIKTHNIQAMMRALFNLYFQFFLALKFSSNSWFRWPVCVMHSAFRFSHHRLIVSSFPRTGFLIKRFSLSVDAAIKSNPVQNYQKLANSKIKLHRRILLSR